MEHVLNLSKAIQVFKKYVAKYDVNDPKIALKIAHTYRVMERARSLARSLELNPEDIELASLIGLLHDIGRFEQLKRYNSYFDNQTVDHAKLGLEVLYNDNFILEFVDDEKLQKIIYKAIFNHNKYKIEEDLEKRELMHAKIIRDADKIDIFNTGLIESFEAFICTSEEILENSTISEEVYQTFMENKSVLSSERKKPLDYWVSFLAMIFDLNYDYSYCYIYDRDYINKLIDRLDYRDFKTKEMMKKIKKCGNDFLKNKVCK